MQDVVRMQFHSCAIMLSSEFTTLRGKEEEVVTIIKPMFNKYIQMCDQMSKARIPAIVITEMKRFYQLYLKE